MEDSNDANQICFQLADFDDPRVSELLKTHHQWCNSPEANTPGAVTYALDLKALQRPEIRLWTACTSDGNVLGCGALQDLRDNMGGEIKAMHIRASARGKGLGTRMIRKLLDDARALNLQKVYLETGSLDAFAPARRVYQQAGFVICGPFAAYKEQPNSVFMMREI